MQKNKMKKLIFIWLFAVTASTFIQSQNQANYEIGIWYDFKKAAVTYTFDDLTPNQLPIALPIFDSYGYKMTFYPIISWNPDWTKLSAAAKNGHEVGSHTFSHPNLPGITDDAKLVEEISGSQDFINGKVGSNGCTTIAYPYCAVNEKVKTVVAKTYIGARICSGKIESKTPADYMEISSIVCGTMGLNTAEALNNKVSEAVAKNGWCVFLLHGVNGDGGYSPVTDDLLKTHLAFVNAQPDDYWVVTFSDAVKYSKERDAAQVKELNAKGKQLTIAVTDTLPDNIYDVPLSVKRILPKGWKTAFVYQNGKPLRSYTKLIDKKRYVIFETIPSSEPIIIAKNKQKIKI